jgi:splicing factor 3B subunit 4
MASANFERSQEAIIYVGNIDAKVTEALLCELFTQAGQVLHVHIPRDKITNEHGNYGFVEFRSEQDADYAIRIMHLVKLFGKPIKVNKTGGQDKRTLEVGANLFVGNLDPEVDEKLLYETFSNFGPVLSTKVMRADDSGQSKGYGFVSFDRFEASDQAISAMNGQFFAGRQINVQYAFKKDSKAEKHGSAAERLLAANRPAGESTQ